MLQELNSDNEIYERLKEKTAYLHKGIKNVLNRNEVAHTINRKGSMVSIHFGEEPVTDFASAARSAGNGKFNKFFHGLLDHGVYIAPSAFETWFITDALTYKDLDATIEAVHQVSKEL